MAKAFKLFGFSITQILMAAAGLAAVFFVFKHFSKKQSAGQPSRQKAAPVSGPPPISESEWKAKLKGGDKFALGVFADWCGHCVQTKPAFFKGTKGMKKVHWFDATNSQTKLFEEFGVRGFPTVMYFDGGKKTGTYSGNRTESDFKQKLADFN